MQNRVSYLNQFSRETLENSLREQGVTLPSQLSKQTLIEYTLGFEREEGEELIIDAIKPEHPKKKCRKHKNEGLYPNMNLLQDSTDLARPADQESLQNHNRNTSMYSNNPSSPSQPYASLPLNRDQNPPSQHDKSIYLKKEKSESELDTIERYQTILEKENPLYWRKQSHELIYFPLLLRTIQVLNMPLQDIENLLEEVTISFKKTWLVFD